MTSKKLHNFYKISICSNLSKTLILHTSTLCWSRCFQITFKSRYYIVLGSSFPWKAQKSTQTSRATIHGLAKDGLLANMNHNFETNFRCALWEHGEKVTDKVMFRLQIWNPTELTQKTLGEGLFTIHLSMFLESLSGNQNVGVTALSKLISSCV